MNNIAISPTIAMYALQNQNVERKIAKNIDLKKSVTNTVSNTDTNGININETTDISNTNETTDIPSILIPHDDQLSHSNLDANANANASF